MTGKYDRQFYIFTLPLRGDMEFCRARVRYDRQFYIFTLPMGDFGILLSCSEV